MSEVYEDINGFNNLVYVDGRTFELFKQQMITQVRVPAKILHIGMKPAGQGHFYAILSVSRQEKKSGPKKSEPGQDIPADAPAENV